MADQQITQSPSETLAADALPLREGDYPTALEARLRWLCGLTSLLSLDADRASLDDANAMSPQSRASVLELADGLAWECAELFQRVMRAPAR